MKNKTQKNPKNVSASIRRNLGKGPKPTAAPDDFIEDDDFAEDDWSGFEAEYRSERRECISHGAPSRVLQFHPDTVRDLAIAIAGSLRFHPDTTRELAKALVLNLQLHPETIKKLAEATYELLQRDMAALIEQNAKQADGNIDCSECADDGHRHRHPSHDMTTEDICILTGWQKSTVYARTKKGLMPPPVSAVVPLMYDPHCIALLKEHGLVFPQARYDRAVHLALLPTVEAERAKKKEEFHKNQSALMKQENKRRAAKRTKDQKTTARPSKKAVKTKSTHTRTSKFKKR